MSESTCAVRGCLVRTDLRATSVIRHDVQVYVGRLCKKHRRAIGATNRGSVESPYWMSDDRLPGWRYVLDLGAADYELVAPEVEA